MKGLEIGGSDHPGYIDYDHVDLYDWGYPTIIADARDLPIEDNTYDHVYASQVLEHFSWRETKEVVKEWLRVLVPGGLLEISVPDTIGILIDYQEGKNVWEHTCERLAGTQDYVGNTHLAFFTVTEFHSVFPDNVDIIEILSTHRGGGIGAKVRKRYQ